MPKPKFKVAAASAPAAERPVPGNAALPAAKFGPQLGALELEPTSRVQALREDCAKLLETQERNLMMPFLNVLFAELAATAQRMDVELSMPVSSFIGMFEYSKALTKALDEVVDFLASTKSWRASKDAVAKFEAELRRDCKVLSGLVEQTQEATSAAQVDEREVQELNGTLAKLKNRAVETESKTGPLNALLEAAQETRTKSRVNEKRLEDSLKRLTAKLKSLESREMKRVEEMQALQKQVEASEVGSVWRVMRTPRGGTHRRTPQRQAEARTYRALKSEMDTFELFMRMEKSESDKAARELRELENSLSALVAGNSARASKIQVRLRARAIARRAHPHGRRA
jgi:septal ring factor EnvC (AmiA/AmiB activator)